MVRIAICDDYDNFLEIENEIIASYMEEHDISYQIDTFHCGEELINKEDICSYHLIFLDVDMEKLNGIETAKKIRERSDVPIAFVTAFLSYSLEGYKVNAVRYILKEMENFADSIHECLNLIMKKDSDSVEMTFKFREGERIIPSDELVYIESSLHYCQFHRWCNGRMEVYSMREKLDAIENQLGNRMFCRIHKSCIVNMKYIKEIKRYYVDLSVTTDKRLLIAQAKYRTVKASYADFCGRVY